MGGRKDYYEQGRRDAEYDRGRNTPHGSFVERLFWDSKKVRDREDYREGYEDGSKK